MKNKKLGFMFKSCLLLSASLALSGVSAYAAPQYPPSIEAPTVGEPIQAPVAPKNENARAVVPVAKSENIPALAKAPIPASRAVSSSGVIRREILSSTPVEVFSGVAIGGLSSSKANNAPTATINTKSSKPNELQVASDVPTVAVLSGFSRSANVTVTLVSKKGKVISLGSVKANSSGRVTLPAITLDDQGDSFTIRVSSGGRSTSILVRATN